MNKYVNLINDEVIINFLNQELNGEYSNYYNEFKVSRHTGGITVNFKNGHGDKITAIFTDYYILSVYEKFKAIQKNWHILLTKKFGYTYLNDLKEEISEKIRQKHKAEVLQMDHYFNRIEKDCVEK